MFNLLLARKLATGKESKVATAFSCVACSVFAIRIAVLFDFLDFPEMFLFYTAIALWVGLIIAAVVSIVTAFGIARLMNCGAFVQLASFIFPPFAFCVFALRSSRYFNSVKEITDGTFDYKS